MRHSLRTAFAAALLATAVLAPSLCAQNTSILINGGLMQFDGGGDAWNPSVGVGVLQSLSGHFRVGLLASYAHIGSHGFTSDQVSAFVSPPNVQISRGTAFFEYDIAAPSRDGLNKPAIYIRAGMGIVHVAGQPELDPHSRFVSGNGQPRTGRTETLGAGFRIPLVHRIAMQLGVDYDADQVLGPHAQRNLTSALGVAITP